jgi:hypothetical protein
MAKPLHPKKLVIQVELFTVPVHESSMLVTLFVAMNFLVVISICSILSNPLGAKNGAMYHVNILSWMSAVNLS